MNTQALTIDTEAIRTELEILDNDKRKGRAYLDHSLRATLKALEAREHEINDYRNRNRALVDMLAQEKRDRYAWMVAFGLTLILWAMALVIK